MSSQPDMTLPDGTVFDFSAMTNDEIAQILWGVQPSEILPSAPLLGKCRVIKVRLGLMIHESFSKS